MTASPTEDLTVVLVDQDVHMARGAVRRRLQEIGVKYRREVRRGATQFAESKLEQFDRYLDLYERLGGDPAEVPEPDQGGVR